MRSRYDLPIEPLPKTLGDLIRRPDLTLVEIVVQDEYTHDVVMQQQRAAGTASFLVYDTT